MTPVVCHDTIGVIVLIENPADCHSDVLAQSVFECVPTLCLVQGFACSSSLSLKILFDYGEEPA